MPRIVPAVLHLRGHLLTFSPSHKVDWGLLAKSPWYTTAAKNSKQVGKLVASLITFLVSEGAEYGSFHVLGASLGAHVAGYVGYFCQGKIGRITGVS